MCPPCQWYRESSLVTSFALCAKSYFISVKFCFKTDFRHVLASSLILRDDFQSTLRMLKTNVS